MVMVLAQLGGFSQILANMQQMGFFQYLFPFLLTLAVLYGIMTYALADRFPKAVRGLISLIISFFVMLWASANPGVVGFFANISGYWLIVGSGILFVLVLLGLVGVKTEEHFLKGKYGKWALILTIIAIGIVIFVAAGGAAFVAVPSWVFSTELWTILFFVIILAVVMLMLGGEEKPQGGGKPV